MLKFKGRLVLFLFIMLVITTSCNDNPVIKDFRIQSEFYDDNGYFLGNNEIGIEVEVASNSTNLNYQWTARGGRFLSQGKNKVKYITPKDPGDYNLKLIVSDELGGETTYTFSFSVKGDYPKAVVLREPSSRSFKAGVNLEWTPYRGEDFYSYKIVRSNNFYIDDSAEVIAGINEQSKTTYTDYNIDSNQAYTYQIMVINDQGYLSVSNQQTFEVGRKGIEEIKIKNNLVDIVLDSSASRAYISDQTKNQIIILDTKEDIITEKIDTTFTPGKLILNKDTNNLFISSPSKPNLLIKLDLKTLKNKVFEFDSPIQDMDSANGHLYLKLAGEYNLIKFSIEKEKVEKKKIKREGSLLAGQKIKIIEGKYLLIDETFGKNHIYKLNELTKPVVSFEGGAMEKIGILRQDDAYYLYIAGGYPQYAQAFLFDAKNNVKLMGNFNKGSYPNDLVLDSLKERLFIVNGGKSISVFSTKKYSLVDELKLKRNIYKIALDKRQNKLYLLTSNINPESYDITIINLE